MPLDALKKVVAVLTDRAVRVPVSGSMYCTHTHTDTNTHSSTMTHTHVHYKVVSTLFEWSMYCEQTHAERLITHAQYRAARAPVQRSMYC